MAERSILPVAGTRIGHSASVSDELTNEEVDEVAERPAEPRYFLLIMRHPARRWEWEDRATLRDLGLATSLDDREGLESVLDASAGRQIRQVVYRAAEALRAEPMRGDKEIRVGRFLYADDSPVAPKTRAWS